MQSYGIPFACLWMTWFAAELIARQPEDPDYLGGALAGGFIGWKQYRQTKRRMQEIIDELTGYSAD